jgi:GNAT superfamily N-acetyltransferase
MSSSGVSFREMTSLDIPAGLDLCRASRWNQTEGDWRHFLAAAPHGALVAVEGGTVIGTVATLPYGPFTWISMVLVDPTARGRGVGTALLHRGLEAVPHGSTARLDATPAGEVLYRKLAFAGEYGLTRLFLDASRGGASRGGASRGGASRGGASRGGASRGGASRGEATRTECVRPLAAADWPALLEMDAGAFGASRATLLQRLVAETPEYAWVAEAGPVRGYLIGRHGHVREHLGPLIADSAETAAALLEACLVAHPARRFFIDVPDHQQLFRARLTQLGFAPERPFLRMYRGQLTTPGDPSRVYAITGPEFG